MFAYTIKEVSMVSSNLTWVCSSFFLILCRKPGLKPFLSRTKTRRKKIVKRMEHGPRRPLPKELRWRYIPPDKWTSSFWFMSSQTFTPTFRTFYCYICRCSAQRAQNSVQDEVVEIYLCGGITFDSQMARIQNWYPHTFCQFLWPTLCTAKMYFHSLVCVCWHGKA